MKKILPRIIFTLLLSFNGLFTIQTLYSQVQTGKSYVNITKGATGGTFEPGDTLEIRSAIAVGNFSAFSITQVRYNDTIDNNFTYIPNTLKILTNEGLTFRAFSDAASDDQAMFNGVAKNLRINLGSTATNAISTANTAATGGSIAYNNKPSFYGGVSIMVASFRVKINTGLSYNTMITLPGGAFRYTNSGSPVTVNFAASKIMLFQNLGSCSNYVGANAVIENNGTFGSGNTQNRSASAIVPGYTYTNFSAGQPNDGAYGIANNTSATGATNNGVAKPHTSRVFDIWDIIGDHTGAVSPTAGNTAKAPGTNGGYMAVVNASYATSPAIQQSVTNLCTNTYYDFSAWFRNICSLCACDSNGNGATNGSFNGPYKPGVKPNLTFQLDGIDYYTTGDLPYNGLWAKKGFTYLTGAAQTSFALTIRNNSPGGGGNDWAVDDVSLSTCEPNVDLNITPVLLGCYGVQVDFNVKVKCYFPNYTYYKWQKSTNGGATWVNTGVSGNGTPTLVSGQWEYTTTYPSFTANQVDSGQLYRVVVATSAANLASTACAYSNSQSTMLKIIDCSIILEVQLTSFNGQIINKKTNLKWVSITENNFSHYEVEKSEDGKNFVKTGSVQARNSNTISSYDFSDVADITAPVYYRLKMIGNDGHFTYSNSILLSNKNAPFSVNHYNNPFQNFIKVDYTIPNNGKIDCRLFDSHGKLMNELTVRGRRGPGSIMLESLNNLASGIYTVTIIFENVSISKRVVKVN
ncbi:MAG: T9SS type A sorting domain-containing protein [Ferruginibacter sp.]|nr:T9SS type A sorting domain-containing protein [Ferruginibacter sp.]